MSYCANVSLDPDRGHQTPQKSYVPSLKVITGCFLFFYLFQRWWSGDALGPSELGDRVRGGGEAGGVHKGQPGGR